MYSGKSGSASRWCQLRGSTGNTHMLQNVSVHEIHVREAQVRSRKPVNDIKN
jgi:hypothetical protein